jgi:molecular chaperone DnaJ
MDVNKNYYNILGVDKNATSDEIKKKYRKLAREYHPDVTKTKDDARFKEISEAFSVIGDDKNKTQYDTQSPHGKDYRPGQSFHFNMGGFNPFGGFGGNPFSGNPFEDLFNMFHRREEFPENLDLIHRINITLKDVYNNTQIPIKFIRNIKCPECNFTGFDPKSEEFECDACDGKGTDGFTKCRFCNGTGKIHNGTCKRCDGEKVVSNNEEFAFTNTFRIDKGFIKYMRGLGHQSKHYQNKIGTLTIEANYIHDERYVREGSNLIYGLDLHFQKAIDGYDYIYQHLDDKKYTLKIPAKTKDGDLLRMQHKGLIYDENDNRGDLLFKINIIIDYELL